MIIGSCHTNLDDYDREEWPTQFVAVPREGEWVESKNRKILKVVKVTHVVVKKNIYGGECEQGYPQIRVELHKPSGG
jgi:hypothetical protein